MNLYPCNIDMLFVPILLSVIIFPKEELGDPVVSFLGQMGMCILQCHERHWEGQHTK